MNNVKVVIGSGYGDEGKGLFTDYFANQMRSAIVVRCNGGAQAGHTVVANDFHGAVRHVFSHFGSGSIVGNPTYLSEHFVVNPLLFIREFNELSDKKITPVIIAHPDAIVTTPFDMLLNQHKEKQRGDAKHGSVGVGVGETLERKKTWGAFTVGDLYLWSHTDKFESYLAVRLVEIRDDYMATVKLDDLEEGIWMSEGLIEDYIKATRRMLSNLTVDGYKTLYDRDLIFECAQGLLLDQDYGYFPYVTRSNTGMKNVKHVLDIMSTELGCRFSIDVVYVTRIYSTRHGAGPMEHNGNVPNAELTFEMANYNIEDETNKPNQWQGSLRTGILNMDLFYSISHKDFALYAPVGSRYRIALTCADQVTGLIPYIEANRLHTIDEDFEFFYNRFDYVSFGPSRDKVTKR